MRVPFPILGSGLLAAALLAVAAGSLEAKPPAPAPSCGQRGRVPFDKDTILSDAGGRPLARFSGGESAVTLLAPPADGSDLASIETGTGRGSFRLRGLVKASELRIYASAPIPLVSGHVWLAAGTRVTAAGTSGGKVRIDKQLSSPFAQNVSATADCSALTFTPPSPSAASTPGSARVFALKEPQLELFASVPPTGAAVLTLRRAPGAAQVRFLSTEQRGGFVHVLYRGELNVDAWAKGSELSPLPRGQAADADVPSSNYVLTSAPQLQLPQLPRVVTASREVPLRLAAKDAEAPVGIIEPDTEVYVMDVVGKWTKVLPKSLHVLPVGEQSFWVKSSDLGT